MKTHTAVSRREFLALAGAAPFAAAPQGKRVPVGLELYSVRNELQKDLTGTVRAVAKMGSQGVEFYSPSFQWTLDYAKEVRRLLDDLGIRCYSTHNGARSFTTESLPRAIELNQTLGSKFIIMASAGKVENLDGWKTVAENLNRAAEKVKPLGLGVGFHNHQSEFRIHPSRDREGAVVEGQRPIEVLATNTGKDVTLQLDVGTCIEAGYDPVAWIKKNPGRITSMHLKDWSPDPDKGYKVLFGEGAAPWKKILDAGEKTGGIQYYLIEQEGSRYPELETAERCLANYRNLRA